MASVDVKSISLSSIVGDALSNTGGERLSARCARMSSSMSSLSAWTEFGDGAGMSMSISVLLEA